MAKDFESEEFLKQMNNADRIKASRIAGVRTVLVVMSSQGMVYDIHSLRHEIRLTYSDATVFFRTTTGKPIGGQAPAYVDLLVDLTGPGQRQGLFYARKLRRGSRFAVGRNAGLFRKRLYNRVFDELKLTDLSSEPLERERRVQKEVLELAGVAFVPTGETHPDRGKTIAMSLPPYQKL